MISVLYVDDENDLCELGKLFLEQDTEFSVDTHTSAREALASPKLRTYDAIISDYQMPEMDGIEFLQDVRAQYGDLPFILFTGRGREEIVIAAINHGVDFYLQKGGDPTAQFAELAHKVRNSVERRRMEVKIRTKQQQLDNFMKNLPVGVFRTTTDSPGKRIMVNPILAQIFGYDSVEEFMVSPLEGSYYDPEARRAIIGRLAREGVVSNVEIQMKKKSGELVWVSMSAVAVPGPDGSPEYLDGILTDITARKTAQDALFEANRKLKLLNSITRHDIRNQLTGLIGFTQVASTKATDPALFENLAKIQTIAETISRQIEFTRAYQELGINVPAWLRLDDVIKNTATPVPVTFAETCGGIEIFADPMLEQVFFNLFENASRHGKNVTEIRIRCKREPDNLRILVEDDGIGIPPEHKEKIFKRGFGKNTGLGLFLAKEILSITGISIRETGIPGKGARFEMTVPAGSFRLPA